MLGTPECVLCWGAVGGCPEIVEAWDLKRGNGFAWHCSILWQWFSEHYLCGGRGRDEIETPDPRDP